MTTPRGSLHDAGTTPLDGAVPAVALRGHLGAAEYVVSDRSAGTMSASVGGGDHQRHRTALAAAVGLAEDQVAWMRQVHGGDVSTAAPGDPPPACDGIVATTPGVAVAVLVADCVPVLYSAPGGVAAAHAGRAGVLAGIAGTTAARLARAAGCGTDDLDVLIGPAIGPCCYEVPADLAAAVEQAVPGTVATTTWGTPSLDLVAGVRSQLHTAGVSAVVRAGGCTRCGDDGRWYSHRATGGPEQRPAGRQAGLVVQRGGRR